MIQNVKRLSMAKLHRGWFAAVLASALLSVKLVGAPSPVASAPATAPAPEEPLQIKSVFVDRPNFGRDPFFPNSDRRGKLTPTNSAVEVVANFNNIALKGISAAAEKRLAIINNKTFEVGEEAELRISGHLTKVKCVEVREKSVVISINGVTKELFLKL
jgi:type II secretory pathway component PulC